MTTILHKVKKDTRIEGKPPLVVHTTPRPSGWAATLDHIEDHARWLLYLRTRTATQ